MVGHKTIGIDLTAKLFLKLDKILSVILKIIIRGKHSLSVMSPLHYMMWRVGKNHSCLTWHNYYITQVGNLRNQKNKSVPFFVSFVFVRIYKNVSDAWVQIGSDIVGEAVGDLSNQVSLSANGSIVAVGPDYNDGNSDRFGHVRVFKLKDPWPMFLPSIMGNRSSKVEK